MSDRISRMTTARPSAQALSQLSLAGLVAAVALAWHVPSAVQAAGLPTAQLDLPPVAVTELTSFHYNGQGESTGEGARGWPSMADPSSPPLFVTHPLSQRPYLFGGSIGQALQAIGSVGLWWMPASPGHYERLAVDENRVYGLVPGTPVKGRDGSIYGVVVSMFAESMAADAAETAQYAHAVRKGVVFRTEFDGTHLVPIASTRGKLNMPNGALVIDAQDNLYGVDQGEQGHGRIFRVGADGSFSTLHEFGPGPDGRKQVVNDIILASDGWIYGISGYDRGLPKAPGVSNDPELPVGALFRINPAAPGNGPSVLHTFRLKDGEINVQAHSSNDVLRYYPSGELYVRGTAGDVTIATNGVASMTGLSSLVEGPDGYLYGTTSINRCQVYARWQAVLTVYTSVSAHTPLCGYRYYGANVLPQNEFPHYDGSVAHGAVYRIPKDAADQGELQLLHTFSGTDGSTPRGPLAVGKDGNIYGTTLSGGSNHHWLYSTRLLDRAPTCEDLASNVDRQRCIVIGAENYASSTGYKPIAYADRPLPNGTLYRIVTSALAPDASGRATQSGFQSVHSFKYDVDGFRPLGVRAGDDGRLYGVTSRGGTGYVNQRGETQPYDDHGAVFVVDLDGNTPSASVTLTVSPNEIGEGQNATLTWTSYQTRDCQATSSKGDWQGAVEPEGSVTLTPPSGTLYYTMQCIDSVKGTTVSDVVVLYVNAPITGRDGNVNNYGNGGGGSLPYGLLGLLGLAAIVRRRGALPPA